ncbi:MAG: SufD family Fe-S cluster assembly protein [Candidatus Moranbacteria bacterium]|nr:SufD family Fe-S cluster assembly protein [Candidatus Moranbacteria bacterium]
MKKQHVTTLTKNDTVQNLTQKKHVITKPGRYVFILLNWSGTLHVTINTSKADVLILGLINAKRKERYSLSTVQHHKKPDSQSQTIIKIIAQTNSHVTFNGTIRIEKNAQNTIAKLTNNNLRLSEKSFVSATPNLEIMPNNVECTHAITTASPNTEHIHYIKRKGIEEKQAIKLLTDGFANSIFQEMKKYDETINL